MTYIAVNALEIFMSSINSIEIYSNDGMVGKSSVSAFQNFLQIENWLNMRKLWTEMCGCVLYRQC